MAAAPRSQTPWAARTQLYSVVALGSALAVLLGARGILAGFLTAALGTVVAMLALGVLYGVLVAIALSIFDLLRRVWRGPTVPFSDSFWGGGDARRR